MQTKNIRRGFTLIELLVVVLIIAILAAVALPQYQKAVDRARFAQIWTAARAVKDAQEVYYLANGSYATSLEELDIDASKIYSAQNQIRLVTCSSGTYDSVYVFNPKLPGVFLLWIYSHSCRASDVKSCYADKNNKRANALCATMANRSPRTLADDGTCNAGAHCTYGLP